MSLRRRSRYAPSPARCARAASESDRAPAPGPRPFPRRCHDQRWRTSRARVARFGRRRSSAAPSGSAPAPARSSIAGASCRRPACGLPVTDQPLITGCHVVDRALIVELVGEPGARRSAEDAAADREAAAKRHPGRDRKGAGEFVLRRLEAEQQHAVAPGIPPLDDRHKRAPGWLALRLQLPPCGANAEVIEPGQAPGGCMVVKGSTLRRNDEFEQELPPELVAIRLQRLQPLLLALPQLPRVIGVIEREALDDVVRGPDQERKAEVVARIEAQWPRPRYFRRTRHPVTGPAQALQGAGAVALVDDHADVLRLAGPLGHALDGFCDEALELCDARRGDTRLTCERLQIGRAHV